MILRKPYAFLIKYFRIIHILIFVIFTYLIFAIRPIYLFFNAYIGNNNMYFEDITSRYVPFVLFVVVLALLALSISIFFLMRKKEKPILFYKFVIAYSFGLFVYFIYCHFFFESLSRTNYTNLQAVINRDIVLAIYIVNFVFFGFSFIRAFGFDIKKFSFEKDRKELQLEETDSEEYEVGVKLEKEDIKDFLNHHIREFKYYIEENSTFFITVSIILVVSLSLYFGYNYFTVKKVFKQNDDVTIGKITYNVNKSVIVNYDKYGKVIGKNNDFLVVYINLSNNGGKVTLDDQQFRVNVSDEYYYPATNYCDLFNDLGTCYHDSIIAANSKQDYIMVYKLGKEHSKIFFEILNNKKTYQYRKIKLDFTVNDKTIENYTKGDNITINDNILQVINYQLLDKDTYIYEECVNDKCDKYTKIVKPKLGNKVLKLEISNIDKMDDDFIKNYIGLKYRNKVLYGSDMELIDRYQNTIYLDIANLVHAEDKLLLIINTRSKEYDILLKEGVSK